MPGNKRIRSEILLRVELIVSSPAQARVANIEAARFLIQQSVRDVEHQAAREPAVNLNLECMRATRADIAVTGQEVTQSVGKGTARLVGRRLNTIA